MEVGKGPSQEDGLPKPFVLYSGIHSYFGACIFGEPWQNMRFRGLPRFLFRGLPFHRPGARAIAGIAWETKDVEALKKYEAERKASAEQVAACHERADKRAGVQCAEATGPSACKNMVYFFLLV